MITFAIIILGLILRLIAVNQSLWLDEAISVQLVTSFNIKEILISFSPQDFNPPLYYLVLFFWLKIFPDTEFFIRLPSILFGILTGPFIYQIYFELFKEKKGAKIALFLLMTSPLHIYYSQEARTYSLAAFLVAVSMFCFIKFFKSKNFLFSFFYILSSILMLYSHYLCFFIIFVQLIYLLIWKKHFIKIFLKTYLLILIFYLPWLPTLFNQLSAGNKALMNKTWSTLGTFNLKNIFLLPVKFIIGRSSFDNKVFYYVLVLLLLAFFISLIFKAFNKKILRVFKNKAEVNLEILIWLWLILPVILGFIISLKIPIFSYFRFLFCLPAFYLLVSRGALRFKKPSFVILVLMFINLFFTSRYLFLKQFHRENWKKAVKVLQQKNFSNNPVLILENITAPFEYYDKKVTNIVYFKDKNIIVDYDTVWLIPYAQPIFDADDSLRKYLKKQGFERVYEEHFGGVTLEKWQKHLAFRYN